MLCFLATFGVTSYIRNSWVPFRGPLPSDGPVEGFADDSARIDFFDTNPLRVRMSTIYALSGFIVWGVGAITSFLILNSLRA